MDASGILGQVILGVEHIPDQRLGIFGQGVGEDTAGEIFAGGVEQGGGDADLLIGGVGRASGMVRRKE